jgi:hypothetical protein
MNARKLESDGGVVAVGSPRLELVRKDHALPDRPCAEAALAGESRVPSVTGQKGGAGSAARLGTLRHMSFRSLRLEK